MSLDQYGQNSSISNKALILGFLLASMALLLFAGSGILFILGLSSMYWKNSNPDIGLLSLSGGLLGMGLLLLPGSYFSFRKSNNINTLIQKALVLKDPVIVSLLIGVWVICLLVGNIAIKYSISSVIFLPGLNFLGVLLPILLYLHISLRNLKLPTPRLGWSMFGGSLIIPPILAAVLEAFAIAIIILMFWALMSASPDIQNVFNTYLEKFQFSRHREEDILIFVANILSLPYVGFTLVGIFAIVVPIIEEIVKVMLLLPFLNRIQFPFEGFVLGTLCGAAFALTENIGFTSSGSENWAVNVALRATSALPHIFNSGLLGWGLASARKEKKWGTLGISFFTIILIHGGWNALSLALALNEMGTLSKNINGYFQGTFPWTAVWAVLIIGLFTGLVVINRKLQKNANDQYDDGEKDI